MAGPLPNMGYRAFLKDRNTVAVEEVQKWLDSLDIGLEFLSDNRLYELGFGKFYYGWKIFSELFPEEVSALILLIDENFPYSQPRISIEGDDTALKGPHVEKSGLLCLAGDEASVATCRPADVVQQCLIDAESLIRENVEGFHDLDYITDFEAYWRRDGSESEGPVGALLEDHEISRLVWVASTASGTFVAEDKERLKSWLKNMMTSESCPNFERGIIVFLKKLPAPNTYPGTVSELRALIKNESKRAISLFDTFIQKEPKKGIVLLAGRKQSGKVAYGACSITPVISEQNKNNRVRNPVTRGFRKGKVDPKILCTRYFLKRHSLKRLDSWKLRLEQEPLGKLKGKHVTLFGCGSLGSSVANMLVRSGVEKLTVVDPDNMGWENIGRHELGANNVGINKAIAMEKKLRREFPEVCQVTAVPQDLIGAIKENPNFMDGSDLIISATADWNSNSALNDFVRQGFVKCPILYTWIENKAIACHAVVIFRDGGCLQCGFEDTGSVRVPVSEWPDVETSEECGGGPSIYGGIELGHCHALAAQLALDVLTEQVTNTCHRVWIGEERFLGEEGKFNSEWINKFGKPSPRGAIYEVEWESSPDCRFCKSNNK